MSKATWLTPAAEVWEARMGAGTFPAGLAARTFKPLTVAGHAMETVALHLGEYLAKTNPQFISLPRFAMTFQQWAPAAHAAPAPKEALPLVDETGVLRLA